MTRSVLFFAMLMTFVSCRTVQLDYDTPADPKLQRAVEDLDAVCASNTR